MKTSALATFAFISALQSSLAFAQDTAATHPLQGLQGTLGIQAGNYNFNSYDKGRLQEFVLKQMQTAQQADRDYILVKSAEIELAVNSFISQTINGDNGIQTLADNAYAAGQGAIDLTRILMAKRNYDTALKGIQNKIASIKALPSAMRNEETVSLEGSGIVQLRTSGRVDLTELLEFYKGQVDSINAQVQGIRFTSTLPNGAPMVQKTLGEITGLIATVAPYSPAQIQAMKDQEFQLRNLSTSLKLQLQPQFTQVLRLVNQYRQDFGSAQKWRANTTPQAREDILRDIETAFWANSLLRATYGYQLGAIGIAFRTRSFNAEEIFARNDLTFESQPVRLQDRINSQRRQLLIALGVMEHRDANVLAGETAFTNRILSALTIIKGEWQLADVNVQLLKLLYADMAEEAILASQGYEAMRAHYQERWYTGRSEAEIAAIRARADDWLNSDQNNMDNIRGSFSLAAKEGEKYLVRLQQANQLREQIEIFDKNSDVHKKYRRPL